jgi:hypothetical protein
MMTAAPASGVERKDGCWYTRDVFALLAHPAISADLRAELDHWVRRGDANVRARRPFAVLGDGSYSFDWRYRATHGAPIWWVEEATRWGER